MKLNVSQRCRRIQYLLRRREVLIKRFKDRSAERTRGEIEPVVRALERLDAKIVDLAIPGINGKYDSYDYR